MKHLLATFLLLISLGAGATMLPPVDWMTVTLSDGTELEVQPVTFRDTDLHSLVALARTRDGHLITEVGGYWYLAVQDKNLHWQAGEPLVTGSPDASTLQPQVAVAQQRFVQSSAAVPEHVPYRYQPELFPGTFDQPLLVIRVAFRDTAFTYSDSEIANRFYGSSNSVRAYYQENSYGRFNVVPAQENSGVAGDGIVRVTLDSDHPDFGSLFGSDSQNLVRMATAQAASYIDVRQYDRNGDGWLDPSELAVVVMVAGYEQAYAGAGTSHPRIWAHKSSIYQARLGEAYFAEYAMFGERHQTHLATIGVICHELGHLLLDLPDLYSGSRSGASVGRWGLMGQGGWNSANGQAGDRPGHMLVWSKELAGFIEPRNADSGNSNVSLRAVSDAADAVQVNLDNYGHGQRLILEHRHRSGFDAGLPGEGVLISRVNDRAGFSSVSELADEGPLLVIEEADGRNDLVANNNPGEASDLFNSFSAGLQLAPVANTVGNEVELLSVEAGLVAYMQLQLQDVSHGANIGLDDLPPNDFYGTYGGSAAVRMTLATEDALTADGVDIFMAGDSGLTIRLLTDSGDLLVSQKYQAGAGWNRLLFTVPVSIADEQSVVLEIDSQAQAFQAPLVIDAQGMASGLTEVRASGAYSVANFDVSARLLVAEEPVQNPPDLSSPVVSSPASSGGSSSGGGAFGWPLLLLSLLSLVRLRAAVRD